MNVPRNKETLNTVLTDNLTEGQTGYGSGDAIKNNNQRQLAGNFSFLNLPELIVKCMCRQYYSVFHRLTLGLHWEVNSCAITITMLGDGICFKKNKNNKTIKRQFILNEICTKLEKSYKKCFEAHICLLIKSQFHIPRPSRAGVHRIYMISLSFSESFVRNWAPSVSEKLILRAQICH